MSVIKKIKVGETTYNIAMDLVSNIQTPSNTEAPSTSGVMTYVAAEIAKIPSPTYDTTISSSSANTNAPGTLAVYQYVQDNKLTKENSITSSATHNTVPSSLAVKNYVDANAGGVGIDVEIGTDQGGMLNLDNYTPTSGKVSYVCMIPASDYMISGATSDYGFWICYGDSWTDCSAVKWCKNGTWVTCYNSDYYTSGENPVGIYRAGNAILVKMDYTNTSNRPIAYLLTLPEPYGQNISY